MNCIISKAYSILIFSIMCFSAVSASNKKDNRPNILWIYIEDMNPSMGCYGDFTVPTPNTDKLAKEGVLFTKCFVPAGVCSPTRSSLITGKIPTTIGVHNHDGSYTKLPDYLEGNILPEIFRKNGYATFNQGKDHYNFIYMRDELYSIPVQKTMSMHPGEVWRIKTNHFSGKFNYKVARIYSLRTSMC